MVNIINMLIIMLNAFIAFLSKLSLLQAAIENSIPTTMNIDVCKGAHLYTQKF